MIAPADLAECRDAIRTGSRSFHAASKLMPARVRDPALALYAFCRLADDAVDLGAAKLDAIRALRQRLDRIYAGAPADAAPDRAFAATVRAFSMPRALPEALLEGLEWDARGRRYETLGDLLAYCARVASSVGVMMCVLMEARDRHTLARAADLGLAMQITNIARDIGEDAAAGRLYLPLSWLDEAGIAPGAFLPSPGANPAVRKLVSDLLVEARRLYARAASGVPTLPFDCRAGVFAAGAIYSGIGDAIARNGFDSVSVRARTGAATKLTRLAASALRALATPILPQPATLYSEPDDATRFLVDAAARPARRGAWGEVQTGRLIGVLAALEAGDRSRRARLAASTRRATS
mgnify:CR=1 FL=1